ncbi:extracellular solute-binding protein, family 5 [Halorhabdus tiamatea SARL4B]|uniref:Extracellular solute-binding protein, family 5 n=2 Tax=Halorhabdus tiamatea SARL4B TaxID=1033806 RepID=S6D2F4_9EURY|nr:extracellular solute-binding protein, family 5 [Halorhabdus tiamatea SARL4B]
MRDYGGNYHPQVLTNWTFPDPIKSGEKITLEMSDEYTWTDGTDLTSEDLVAQLEMERIDNWAYWDFLSGVQAVDDYTVELTIDKRVDPKILKNGLFQFQGYHAVNFKKDVFGEYLTDIKESTTDEEENKARQKLSNYQIAVHEANDLGLGLGPFGKYSAASTSKIVLEKYEDYSSPLIDAIDIPYDYVDGLPVDSPQQKIRAMKNERLDATTNAAMTKDQLQSLPDHYNSFPESGHDGGVFVFNCRNSPLDNQKVRWALSNVFSANHDLLLQNLAYAPEMKPKVEPNVGIGGPELIDKWLGDVKDQFMWHDGGTERAAELLSEEGFTRKNGQWYKPNGDRWELTIKGATFHKNRTQTLATILKQFGIAAQPVVEENSVWFGKTIPENNYDITHWWGAQATPIPYFGLQQMLVANAPKSAYLNGVPSEAEWEEEKTEGLVIKLPPIGEQNGRLESFDINAKIETLGTAQSEEEKRPLIQQLTWAWNWMDAYWGPWLMYRPSMFWSEKNWKWPSEDSDMMKTKSVSFWPTRNGEPQPR